MNNKHTFTYRKLGDGDIRYINELQSQRGFEPVRGEHLPPEWSAYGAFSDEGEIAGVCFLFIYRRVPHRDYPGGVIAELGGCYTDPKYRRQGIMSRLVGECLEHMPSDCPQVEAVVSDASNYVIRILMEHYGFVDAVEGERRLWRRP